MYPPPWLSWYHTWLPTWRSQDRALPPTFFLKPESRSSQFQNSRPVKVKWIHLQKIIYNVRLSIPCPLNKIKPPRPLASALVSFLSNYYVKFTISHLTSPLPPHLFSLEKVILMMSWSCLWSCLWSYLWCYLLTSVGDHIKKITCLNSWHVTLSFTWPEFLPPRDFIWFELSINIYPIPYLDSLLCYYIYECERHMEMPHIKSGLKLWNIEFNPG